MKIKKNTTELKLSKNAKIARSLVDSNALYKISDAVALLQDPKFSYVKFDQTVEIAMNLGVDPKHADQIVQGSVKLPAGIGKEVKVAVFTNPELAKVALEAGADAAGVNDKLISDIKSGKIEYDVYIASPDMMPVVAQVARVLGPKGLMPTPKFGTVTKDVANAVKDAKGGKVDFRVDKSSIVHAGIGKVSFSQEDLVSNIESFVEAIRKAKPSGAKGTYIKSMHLAASMTPGIAIEVGGAAAKK